MEDFAQKWAIISLLEDAEEGAEFYYTDFPLHVTLAGVFAIDKDEAWLVNEISRILKGQKPIEIQAEEKAMFGPNQDVAVMKITKSPELLNIYQVIYEWLESSGAIYNEPKYQGSGWLPHSTFQKTGSLAEAEKRSLKSISLVDLYPDDNGYQRKISKTIKLT